jgi:hypothetical protein
MLEVQISSIGTRDLDEPKVQVQNSIVNQVPD